MNDTITLPFALAKQIGEYLSHRPYREVATLLAALAEAAERKPEAVTETQGA